MHKILFVPDTSGLLEKSALIFLYNFHDEHCWLKLIIKKLSPKINVKNIKRAVPVGRPYPVAVTVAGLVPKNQTANF